MGADGMSQPAGLETPGAMRTTYRLGDAALEVVTDDPGTGRWLSEFLRPWFAVEPSGRAGVVVQFTALAGAHAALQGRRTRATERPVPVFGLDSAVVSLPGWFDAGGMRVLADEEQGCFYRVRPGMVQIVADPGNLRSRVGLLRVVRELAALRALVRPELVDLHAAAFTIRGRAVLLVGGKRAGKTTLLVHALTSGQAGLLANDRVLVDAGSGRVQGVPTMVVVREGTVRTFPALSRGLPGWAALLHGGEAAAGVASPGRQLVLSPAQLAGRTGAAVAAHAPLGAIVFPEISAAAGGLSLEGAEAAEAAARLRENLYGARSGGRERSILREVAGVQEGSQGRPLDRLLAAVPLLVCHLAADAYRKDASGWLRALPLSEAPA